VDHSREHALHFLTLVKHQNHASGHDGISRWLLETRDLWSGPCMSGFHEGDHPTLPSNCQRGSLTQSTVSYIVPKGTPITLDKDHGEFKPVHW
jgi:hypothetical protein